MAAGARPQVTMNLDGKECGLRDFADHRAGRADRTGGSANAPDFARKPNIEKLAPDEVNKIDVAGV